MSKRSEEQLRQKDLLRQKREEREAAAAASGSPPSNPDGAAATPGAIAAPAGSAVASPTPAAALPSPSVGDMRTAGAATRRIAEGWEKGLAAKLDEKTAEAAELANVVANLKALGVEWKILPIEHSLIDVVGFNRFQSAFDPKQDKSFAELLENIAAVGGNKQPGMVRPSPATPGRFELVFGERRLRACQQSALPFTAIVAALSDDDVWLFREAENFGRKDKGILERALGLVDMPERFAYGERSMMLAKLKISKTQYLRLKAIAAVPKTVWEVIPGAHATTAREAAAVVEAYAADPRAVKSRVSRVRQDMRRSDAIKVLTTGSLADRDAPTPAAFEINRKGTALSLKLRSPSDERAAELEDALRQWLEERGLHAATTH